MERRRLFLQVQIELVVRELVAKEVLHVPRLLHLPLMIVEFLQRDVAASFGPENLALEAVNLDIEDLDLVNPLLEPARPARLREIDAAVLRRNVGHRMRDTRDGLE